MSERMLIINIGVPESVYNHLQHLADLKGLHLDQLCSVAIGAGLADLWKREYFIDGTD